MVKSATAMGHTINAVAIQNLPASFRCVLGERQFTALFPAWRSRQIAINFK